MAPMFLLVHPKKIPKSGQSNGLATLQFSMDGEDREPPLCQARAVNILLDLMVRAPRFVMMY